MHKPRCNSEHKCFHITVFGRVGGDVSEKARGDLRERHKAKALYSTLEHGMALVCHK